MLTTSRTISRQLSEVESMVARSAWLEVRTTLEADRNMAASTPELVVIFAESLLRTGAPAEAFGWLQARLHQASQSANRRAWMRALNLAGAAALEIGRISEAEEYFAQVQQLASAREDHLLNARATNNLALVASMRGEWGTALAYYALAIPVHQRVGSLRGLAECYHNMATTLLEAGELDRAEEAERQAVEYARDVSSMRLHAHVMTGRADILLRKGDYQLSLVLGRRAFEEFETLDDPTWMAQALRIVGLCQLGQVDAGSAEETLTNAINLAARGGVVRVSADCHLARARVRVSVNDVPGTKADLDVAASLFEQLGSADKLNTVRSLQAGLEMTRG